MLTPDLLSFSREAVIKVEAGPNGELKDYLVSYDEHIEEQIFQENLIGEGGFGAVFKIALPNLSMKFAVKKINQSQSYNDNQEILRSLKDVVILREIGNVCPNLVKYYGNLCAELSFWLLMELMHTSLDKLCLKMTELGMPINDQFLSKVAKQTLLGLNCMHSKNLIHRDIKPPNILLNSDGMIKICDFGISGIILDGGCTSYVGHDIYMAPERTHAGIVYTANVDVWSLGITLSEIASGKNPILALVRSNEDILGISRAINELQLPNLSADRFHEVTRSFVGKCLIRDPKERPNCASLLNDQFVAQQDQGPWEENIRLVIESIKTA